MKSFTEQIAFLIFRLFRHTKIMAENLRAPQHFLWGRLAKKVMFLGNQKLIEYTINKLNIREGDAILEVGSGSGQAIVEIQKYKPKSIKSVEISPIFKSILERRFHNSIKIHHGDAKNLNGFIETHSIDKLVLINVIYFLSPLAPYLKEFGRVLKKDGTILIAASFDSIKDFNNDVFINKNAHDILTKLREYFSVELEHIKIEGKRTTSLLISLSDFKTNKN